MVLPSPSPVRSFRDALGLAMELADEFAFANAAVLLDRRRNPIDLAVAEGIGTPIDPVVAWAASVAVRGPGPAPPPLPSVLVLSVRPHEPDLVREGDLRTYRNARWTLGRAGRDLLDWIETDGDLYRSFAYLTCPATAWSDDPPEHRRADGAP